VSHFFQRFYQSLRRRPIRTRPIFRTGRISWGDLRSLEPVSRDWGFDRGTPIDRYYIEQFLASCEEDIHGRVMEVGTNKYTKLFGGKKITRSDVIHPSANYPLANMTLDLTDAGLIPNDIFDCIICTQTLQFIYDVRVAVATLHRILKPKGVLLVTVPGIAQISREDMQATGEYWRFTDLSMKRLLTQFFGDDELEVMSLGNVLSSIALLQGIAVEELCGRELDEKDPEYQLLITTRAVKSV
jgi:SAM-dependent methyltransferase